jgi:allophanate hydrolase subunit 2
MANEVFEILDVGWGATLQDQGRSGWRRFGVPPSGAMDDHAMDWANRLLDNPSTAPALELLWQGARLRVLRGLWIVLTGADAQANVPTWRTVRVKRHDVLDFPHNRSGVWSYLAVEGGFDSECILGSASAYPRGGLGNHLARGQRLRKAACPAFRLPSHVAGRVVDWGERRNYNQPPILRCWRGPQWNLFDETARTSSRQDWMVVLK